MKPLLNKIIGQQCPKHGSPYGFIYNGDVETNESRMMCDECITPSNAIRIISIRKAFKFLEEKQIQENQSRQQLTSLWQQFKHNSEKIRGILRDLEELMEQLINSNDNNQLTKTLNDEFLNGIATQPNIETVGQNIGSLIDMNSKGELTLKQPKYLGQQEENCDLQCNNILEGQKRAYNELGCLLGLIQNPFEQNKNLNQQKEGNVFSLDIANYSYETKQTIKVKDYCYWVSLNCNETQIVAAVEKSIKFYQLSQGEWMEEQFLLEGHTNTIYQVKFNHNSTLVASRGSDNKIIIWSKHFNGQWSIFDKFSGPEQCVWSFCFNHDSSLLASGSNNGTIQIHNLSNGQCVLQQSMTQHYRWVYDVCFNNDSTKLASGSSDHSIIIWHNIYGNWRVFQTLKEHTNRIWSVQFNSESNQLISSSSDQTIKIWEVNNEKWKLMHTLTGHSDKVNSAQFNKQSNMIISGSQDKSIKIWKFNQEGIWKCTQTIDEHQNPVTNVIFNSDSSMIISCSVDTTIKIHKIK